MKSYLNKDMKILLSHCDNRSLMSIPSIFSLFMDLATENAPSLGLGNDVLSKKGLFWVAVRTKIAINELPKMMDNIEASTWPEVPGRARCTRYYKLETDNKTLVEGKTEWAIIDIESGRPHKLSEIYPPEIEHLESTVCDSAFSKIDESIENCTLLRKYTVSSIDIDLGMHMNNAAYIRALFSLLSCEDIERKKIKNIEINYRTPSFEGEELSVFYRENNAQTEYIMLKEDGKVSASILIS